MPKENSSIFLKNSTQNSLVRSRLIKLLAKLSSTTVKQFKAWHKQQGSPNRDAFLILKYILSYYPVFDSPKLTQEIAFKRIFGKIPYDYRRLMKGVSQVHLDLKQYLIKVELAEDDFLNGYLLAKVYTKYDLSHEKELLVKKKKKTTNQYSQPLDFYEQMQWNEITFFEEIQHSKKKSHSALIDAEQNLDLFFLAKKLKYACEIAIQQKLYQLDYNIPFSEMVANYCTTNYAKLPLFHQIYFSIWQLINSNNYKNFLQLKTVFYKHYTLFQAQDRLYLLTHLLNFVIERLRKKETNALSEAFELYAFGVDKAIFVQSIHFRETHFTNIIGLGSALEKFSWMNNLINSELGQSVKTNAPSIYNLALARFNFAKGDFQACQIHLLEVDYHLFTHSFKARIYQLACLFELKTPAHILETNCKAFENYLRRYMTKYTPIVQSCLNYINIVRQLNKLQSNKTQLQENLNLSSPIAFQVWLQQKIDNLK